MSRIMIVIGKPSASKFSVLSIIQHLLSQYRVCKGDMFETSAFLYDLELCTSTSDLSYVRQILHLFHHNSFFFFK
jgi:hypothetical protein